MGPNHEAWGMVNVGYTSRNNVQALEMRPTVEATPKGNRWRNYLRIIASHLTEGNHLSNSNHSVTLTIN